MLSCGPYEKGMSPQLAIGGLPLRSRMHENPLGRGVSLTLQGPSCHPE